MENLAEMVPWLILLIKIFGSIISFLLLCIIGMVKHFWGKVDRRFEKLEDAIKDSKKEYKDDIRGYQNVHEQEHRDIWKAIDECCPRGK